MNGSLTLVGNSVATLHSGSGISLVYTLEASGGTSFAPGAGAEGQFTWGPISSPNMDHYGSANFQGAQISTHNIIDFSVFPVGTYRIEADFQGAQAVTTVTVI